MNLWMSCLIYGSEDGRSKTAVTHLASALGVKIQETAFRVLQKMILEGTNEKQIFSVKYKGLYNKFHLMWEICCRDKKLQIKTAASFSSYI